MKMFIRAASLIVSAVVLLGCGGGGSDPIVPTPGVDNAAVAEGENAYGYYGAEVVFGSTPVVGVWTSELQSTGEPIGNPTRFYHDGVMNDAGFYGVSKDGQIVQTSDGRTIVIRNELHKLECYDAILDREGFAEELGILFCRVNSDPDAVVD